MNDEIWAAFPAPCVRVNAQDVITSINPETESFLNTSAKVCVGQHLWHILSAPDALEAALERARLDGNTLFVEEVALTPRHTRAPLQCALRIAPLAEGDMLLLILPRAQGGRETAQQQQVSRAAQSAIGMAEMLAHEIKNPLAGIIGAAQLIEMQLKGEDRDMSNLIVQESRRIVKLLDQVEQFGNVNPPDRRAVNIHDVLDRARRSALVGFGAGMEIVQEYDPSLPEAYGDADQLLQVFQNLLKNAAEACGGTGVIRLHSFYEQGARLRRNATDGPPLPLQIEVIDDGPGLPDAIAANVFEPFVSGRENGTGLGLALVSKIISEHEGWITLSSAPGRTIFRVSLPLAPTQKQEKH